MSENQDSERIVVRAPNWLGDLVMATPGFRALRACRPKASITLHVPAALAPLLAGSPWFDHVLPMDGSASGLAGVWREGRRLGQAGPFDLGICIPDSFSSALVMRAAGVRHVMGFERGGRGVFLHEAIDPPSEWGPRRMVARETFVLTLIGALGGAPGDTRLELYTTAAEEAAADAILAELEGTSRLVGVAPGASFGSAKLWPAESYAELADRLIESGDQVLLLGAPSEAPLLERVRAHMKQSAPSLAGMADLGTSKAIIRRLSLLVGNDAGARHMAVAFAVPTVVFMGPTSLGKTNLNLEHVEVLTADVDCRPCYKRECPIDHRCMTQISPREALAASETVRANASGAMS